MICDLNEITDIAQARSARVAAWTACGRGQISTSELYDYVRALRRMWGAGIYERASR